jgi:hypothetical protein
MSLGGIFNETCAGCGVMIGLTAGKLHAAHHEWMRQVLLSLLRPDDHDPAALLNANSEYQRELDAYQAGQEEIRRKTERFTT